jgi:hypothetical protein
MQSGFSAYVFNHLAPMNMHIFRLSVQPTGFGALTAATTSQPGSIFGGGSTGFSALNQQLQQPSVFGSFGQQQQQPSSSVFGGGSTLPASSTTGAFGSG